MGINEIEEEIKKLNEKLEEQKEEKHKKFKLPFRARVGRGKSKKGYVGVLKLNENMVITPSKEKIEEQTIMIDGVPRLATGEYVWRLGKQSIIIQPSWSVEPIAPKSLFQKSIDDNTNTKGFKILLAKMKNVTLDSKKQVSGWLKWILGLGLAGVIIYAFITSGGN